MGLRITANGRHMMRMYGLFLRDLYPDGLCHAKTRKGTPCKIRQVFKCKNGKLRCRYHGGLSTGPKTPEGKERALKALREGWARWRAKA